MTKCLCKGSRHSRIVRRQQDEWGAGQAFGGYVVELTVLMHVGRCPLNDEVLDAKAVKSA